MKDPYMDVDQLFDAIRNNDIKSVSDLIKNIPKDDFDWKTAGGWVTALILAIDTGKHEYVKIFKKLGARS